ncbi:MAG: ABZJ_00895 family protein [Oceanospirillaceae bacterium]
MNSEKVSLKKYMLWFLAVYILLSAIIGGVLIYFDIDSSSPLFIVFIAASAAVHAFVNDHARVMNKSEIWRSTWLSWILIMLFTILTIIGFTVWLILFQNISINDLQGVVASWSLSVGVIVGIIVFVAVLFIAVNRLAFGVCNKLYSKKLTLKE